RERSRERSGHRRRSSRDRSSYRRHERSPESDLYRDLIHDDYAEDRRNYSSSQNDHRQQQNADPSRDAVERERENRRRSHDQDSQDMGSERSHTRRSDSNGNICSDRDQERSRSRNSSDDSDLTEDFRWQRQNTSEEALNNIIIFGLKKHITEADIMGELIKVHMEPLSIRVMRKKPTGASRCFAFVEFKTVEEARRWMDLNKGTLQLGEDRVSMQYSHTRITDWTCNKCGASNFKRRFQCFMCSASRAESESAMSKSGEGVDEISRILTKKIMLRNLDALTNEEGVLTALQEHLPKLAKTVSKVLISKDTLTQASRGICYLQFDTLVDSMNVYNGLMALEPPLRLDDRDVVITYCLDGESRQTVSNDSNGPRAGGNSHGGSIGGVVPSGPSGNYTVADVPRLADYSAGLYATSAAEHAHFFQYYKDYYMAEISKGQTDSNLTEANSGAAVALSAMQRKRTLDSVQTTAMPSIKPPRGNDGKVYPVPDVSKYQFDKTSGYYYDATTGLYYDAHSQYYYNNETCTYLYWDQRRCTYVLATPASTQAAIQEVVAEAEQKEEEAKRAKEQEKEKNGSKPDKVKVAKKIVKDMEKWAKQLNQKKDYNAVAIPQPIPEIPSEKPSTSRAADVCFSILETKEKAKLAEYLTPPAPGPPVMTKLANAYLGVSDSEDERAAVAAAEGGAGGSGLQMSKNAMPMSGGVDEESEYVDFQKLTCLLCKRAFQSSDILQKHLKMSNLHKDNLAKLVQSIEPANQGDFNYRDRAKERRLKYGESGPIPSNRFEREMKPLQSSAAKAEAAAPPISSSNVGSRLLQKMGWSEGQGLGRKNQGRTQIIEAGGQTHNIGLGNQTAKMDNENDYKMYIKKMMKQRYENA
ncbi:hypothetical protein KR018_007162, partial [Drosophila ironensis]